MCSKASAMMYLMLDLESMLLHPLVRFKLEPRQQEKLYWNMIQFLNWMEGNASSCPCVWHVT